MIRGIRSQQNEMSISTRPVPHLPESVFNRSNVRSNKPLATIQPNQKKNPPPRPPLPQFRKNNAPHQNEKSKKLIRSTDFFTNLFGIKSSKQQKINVTYSNNCTKAAQPVESDNLSNGIVSLIDLSPSGSPTFTTRSNSDGVSVDSFSSDGNSNPPLFASIGNSFQTESAFENDFNFFDSLSKPTSAMQKDPWKSATNPFQLTSHNQNTETNCLDDVSFFTCNGEPTRTFNPSLTNNVLKMPTIIRGRRSKLPAPKIRPTSLAPTVPNFNVTPVPENFETCANSTVFEDVSSVWSSSSSNDSYHLANSYFSMPSTPPPALPVSQYSVTANIEPRGIALYDFNASEPGDLSLKQGDIVKLKSRINDDWLQGEIDDRSGIFPANFIDIIVSLNGDETNIVNALYTFSGEMLEDLSFSEGAKITVLSKISDDWLYGECDGEKGQFPVNYVDRVPRNLPNYS